MHKIGFIGAGNMATSLVGGLLQAGHEARHIQASDPNPTDAARALGIEITNDNRALAQWADILVLAIKPQVMQSICTEISAQVRQQAPLIVSIAAGIQSRTITQWLESPAACIRVMPNTPALLGLGMSGLYANSETTPEQIDAAVSIMQTVGEVRQYADESMIDAVTAISGSGPAYFFLLIEAMSRAGETLGLSSADAAQLATRTALGAASMAAQQDTDIVKLRKRVTSPGGTTERAIQTFLDGGFMRLVEDAIRAAHQRSVELSKELSGDDHE